MALMTIIYVHLNMAMMTIPDMQKKLKVPRAENFQPENYRTKTNTQKNTSDLAHVGFTTFELL